jgi:diguanylate cyclase (GGDEF)-like protein
VRPSRKLPRRFVYGLMGALISVGAPLGLLAVRAAAERQLDLAWIRHQLAEDTAVLVYVTVSTLVIFLLFGYVVGRQADRLLQLSQLDPLTGLGNARELEQRLEEETARARRYRHPLSLLFLDVDGLKRINDRDGHHAGDAALLRVADALRQAARGTDFAMRWAGDEFALLAPETASEPAARLAERIRAIVAGPGSEGVTVSVGVATTHGGTYATPDRLRARADAALYAAKGQGRDRVVALTGDAPTPDPAPPAEDRRP